jgi:glucosamine kinase
MIVIADSGSTKTDWTVIDKDGVLFKAGGIGLNPNFFSDEELNQEVNGVFSDFAQINSIEQVNFYGAGCGKKENANRIAIALEKQFQKARQINVETDMLGAVRSCLVEGEFLVAILGTGSNACLARNEEIVVQCPSLGYLLGDFGSGCDIGKRTLTAFLERKFPSRLFQSFRTWINLSDTEIISEIYNKPRPNRFLASVAKFHANHLDDAFLAEFRRSSFRDFFSRQIVLIQQANKFPIQCVGSVGYYFQNEICEIGEKQGFTFDKFHHSPMNGLINYHLKFL